MEEDQILGIPFIAKLCMTGEGCVQLANVGETRYVPAQKGTDLVADAWDALVVCPVQLFIYLKILVAN